MTDIVERLRFDAARCEVDYSKGVAGNIEEAINEIERLRKALESLTEDPPSTLDEPDQDYEVIIKMRAIARDALTISVGTPST
jgi:hypothetical protein